MNQIVIKQGDSFSWDETVTSVDDLTNYTCKMYIYDSDGDEVDVITGSKDEPTVTYAADNDDTKDYAIGVHYFETKLFDISDHVYTESHGWFVVETTLNEDPS